MRIVQCEQGSAEWLKERVGRITASRICEALSKFKNKEGETAERRDYRTDMVVERLTRRSTENFVSPEMVWGRENESKARTAYEMEKDVLTEQAGFIIHPTLDYAGASPDALVGDDGGLEIKCPKTATHLTWMLNASKGVPEEHQDQCLWNMACAERAWWDFASFDPRLPDGLSLFVVRMMRDDVRIAAMEERVKLFHYEVENEISWLKKKVKVRPPKPVDTRTDLEQLYAMMDRQELTP